MRALLCAFFILVVCSSVSLAQTTSQVQCAPPKSWNGPPPGARPVHLDRLIFEGDPRLSSSELETIAEELKKVEFDANPEHGDLNNGEIEERVIAAWEDRGYSEVQAKAESHISPEDPGSAVATVTINAGDQYRLKAISFTKSGASPTTSLRPAYPQNPQSTPLSQSSIASAEQLRSEFPITDNEIFSRDKVTSGLENLRKLYGKYGYINFSPAPSTEIDEINKTISLTIDIDEGKPFRIASVNFDREDGDGPVATPLQQLQPGTIYNSELIENLVD